MNKNILAGAACIAVVLALLVTAFAPYPSAVKFRAIIVETTLQVLGASTTTGLTNTGALTNVGAFGETGATTLTGATTIVGDVVVTGSVNYSGAYSATTGISNVGALSQTGASTLTGATSLVGIEYLGKGSNATVTNGTAFTPTTSFQPITAAGAVTPTITILGAGANVCLENVSANTITLQDTGIQKFNADIALGQYDVLCLLSDGTNWLEKSLSDN